jgi:preprotein translocase subunit SecG
VAQNKARICFCVVIMVLLSFTKPDGLSAHGHRMAMH